MYQSEKQFNTTASVLAIEEVYTNLDIAPNDTYLPYEGYIFCYGASSLSNILIIILSKKIQLIILC